MNITQQPELAELVRALRSRQSLTQEQFAAKLGVTFRTVNRWENAHATPSPMALKLIHLMLKDMGEPGKDLLRRYFAD
ncbi:MAG TPA: helix-turn-helix domain-containing protein [Oscillatoriaceae cyanobacterium M33_DOE_052]|uniref:Helix-turn-helix domain-containing protein n=1 Tax=Planktothricoides sp. SpSt-374 TaxID=2282167 RepID=A0A7C3ZJC2_9CYAN|nr:helix-turn-helix domain-containing protein [Oscillatoriaceae cyanobacterium M33_DOE_052]